MLVKKSTKRSGFIIFCDASPYKTLLRTLVALWEFHDHKQAVYSRTKLEIFHDYELNVINKLLAHNSRNESSSHGRCLFQNALL